MVIGIARIQFRIHDCHSLKGKRKIVKSMITRLQNAYNASVAEVAFNDVHQKAEIGVAMVGNDQKRINSQMDKLLDLAEDMGLAEMLNADIEFIHV
ncbi:MAG: DUF503 domain-containing protein [Proteobacteria bacterium]|nr:DUF503 domain-containing protein [Pseudomonadota bacterium]